MVDTIHPVDAVAGSPSYGGRMLRQVNAVAFGGATAARPLGGRSGVRPGTSTTTVTASSTTWSCGPLAGVADVETAAEAGLVTFALDAVATGAITAASASFARQDLIYIQIDIPVEDGSAVPVVTRKYIAGTVASTDPALPVARAFAIARINVPISGGGSPTVTWIAPYAVAAGGTIPFNTQAERDAATVPNGTMAYRVDKAWFERRVAGAWVVEPGAQHVEFTTTVAAADATAFAVGTVTVDSSASTDTTLAAPIANGLRFQPGVYAINVSGNLTAAATGRSYVGIESFAGAPYYARSGIPVGENVFSVAIPNLRITVANTDVALTLFQTTGASRTIVTRVRVTKVG